MEYATKAATDGSFRFDDVDAGIYVLASGGSGFLASAYGAKGPGLPGTPPGTNTT